MGLPRVAEDNTYQACLGTSGSKTTAYLPPDTVQAQGFCRNCHMPGSSYPGWWTFPRLPTRGDLRILVPAHSARRSETNKALTNPFSRTSSRTASSAFLAPLVLPANHTDDSCNMLKSGRWNSLQGKNRPAQCWLRCCEGQRTATDEVTQCSH